MTETLVRSETIEQPLLDIYAMPPDWPDDFDALPDVDSLERTDYNPEAETDDSETDQARNYARDTLLDTPDIIVVPARKSLRDRMSRLTRERTPKVELKLVGLRGTEKKLTKRVGKLDKMIANAQKRADVVNKEAHPHAHARRMKRVEALKKNLNDQNKDLAKASNKRAYKAGRKEANQELKKIPGYNWLGRREAMKDIREVRQELGRLSIQMAGQNKLGKQAKKKVESIQNRLDKVTSKADSIREQSTLTDSILETATVELAELEKTRGKLMEEYEELKAELADRSDPENDSRWMGIVEAIGQSSRDIVALRDETEQLTKRRESLKQQRAAIDRQLQDTRAMSLDARTRLSGIETELHKIDARLTEERLKVRQGRARRSQ